MRFCLAEEDMAKRDDRFPYWLIVLGFPLFGGLFLGVALAWSWATGWDVPPDPLAVPVEFFLEGVMYRIWDIWGFLEDSFVAGLISLIVVWEVAWLALGVVVALLARFVSLLVPRGKGEEI